MSDEEYLLSQILSKLKTDLPTAKSWMIFSKSVYPRSFIILFQCYKLMHDENNISECAVILHDLVKEFPCETALINELKCFAHALCSDGDDFYKEVFKQLSDDVKFDIMLAVTNVAQSTDEYCQFMISFFKNLPNASFLPHGNDVIDRLLATENKLQIITPINRFRKMLVSDVLPLILATSGNEFKFRHHFHLFERAVEFYVYFMFYHNSQTLVDEDMTVLSARNCDEGWKPLLKLLETVALKCKWNCSKLLFSNFSELSLKNLIWLSKERNKLLSFKMSKLSRRNKLGYEEAYFCLLVTFFYYLYSFGRLIHPDLFSSVTTEQYNYILMEGISFSDSDNSDTLSCTDTLPSAETLPSDFIQTEKGNFVISKCGHKENSDMLICSFVTAVDCWDLLHQNSYLLNNFKKLCSNIKMETCPVFQEFNVNLFINNRTHKDAINYLKKIQHNAVNSGLKDKISLQIASSYCFLKNYEQSIKILFDVVINLPLESTTKASVKMPVIKSSLRYLYFMGCNNTEIIQYCVSVLLKLYKYHWHSIPDYNRNIAVAYVLVLLQYNLDQNYAMLKRCTSFIKKAKIFNYPKFFNYIINVYILEEISHLATPSGGNANLKILPDMSQANELCTIRRNMNEQQQKNLKLAFISQMARCNENLDSIYIEFIKDEHKGLLIPLVDCM